MSIIRNMSFDVTLMLLIQTSHEIKIVPLVYTIVKKLWYQLQMEQLASISTQAHSNAWSKFIVAK